MYKCLEIEVDGTPIKIETHRWALQSDGSALVSYKDTMILVTANMKPEADPGRDFLPLMVDFRENTYAAGKIPGGFFKREGKPSEKEVLLSRLIDRPIRSLFDKRFNHETQIIALLLSADFSVDYDALAIIGASASLLCSSIPFSIPVGAVKIGWKNGEFFINPGQIAARDMDMVILVVGTEDEVVMMEAGGNEFPEELALESIERAKAIIADICRQQKALINPNKAEISDRPGYNEALEKILKDFAARIREAVFNDDRDQRQTQLKQVWEELSAGKEEADEISLLKSAFHEAEARVFRDTLLTEKRRTDGRPADEIRKLSMEVGVLPRVHGSASFTRGQTQALATVTLGSLDDAQRLDSLNGEDNTKSFMLHYNFPPFSVGEVSFLRGAGRREVGHGNLAEKALQAVMPKIDDFPYTVRIVSDILESNGSSSMATVCGGTLALMDAGVPVKAPVAGIAMGLVREKDDFAVLTDIAGYEDHFGDMDFKVAGTEKGVTAIQLDIKIGGLSDEIIKTTLADARKARLFILSRMKEVIDRPSEKLSEYAPIVLKIKIPVEKIRDLIGPGGKTIKELTATFNVKINAEDDGTVIIYAPNHEVGEAVNLRIQGLTGVAELDKVYQGKVIRIEDYGLFVEIMPNVVGLLHVSEISHRRIKDVRSEFKLGDELTVKVVTIDRDNKVRVSMRALEENPQDESPRHNDRPPRR